MNRKCPECGVHLKNLRTTAHCDYLIFQRADHQVVTMGTANNCSPNIKAAVENQIASNHICRGHFKDYRHGKGLFGKHKVMVWTPIHVKGSGKRVKKQYEVDAPGE